MDTENGPIDELISLDFVLSVSAVECLFSYNITSEISFYYSYYGLVKYSYIYSLFSWSQS